MRKSQPLDAARAGSFVDRRFSTSILPTLMEYITIPNQWTSNPR
jgi:hypothetical protein